MIALASVPAHAQLYKWTDASGKVHYSDRPQEGVNSKELAVEQAPQRAAPASDDWRQRERESRERRLVRENANREADDVAARNASKSPYNPSMHRSNKAMTDEEMCTRDAQQIVFAEKTKSISFRNGVAATEEERQAVIQQRKENHALLCGSGQRTR